MKVCSLNWQGWFIFNVNIQKKLITNITGFHKKKYFNKLSTFPFSNTIESKNNLFLQIQLHFISSSNKYVIDTTFFTLLIFFLSLHGQLTFRCIFSFLVFFYLVITSFNERNYHFILPHQTYVWAIRANMHNLMCIILLTLKHI